MVLKKSKHSLNTGCNLKLASYSKGTSFGQHATLNKEYNYRTPAGRVSTSSYSVDSFIDDGNITACKHVYYSLNKHGRWRLLELLKEGVDDIRSMVDDQSCPKASLGRLVVSDRRLVPEAQSNGATMYPANCMGYHDSGSVRNHVYPNKKYSYAFDLKNKAKTCEQQKSDQAKQKGKKRNSQHNQHFRGVQRKGQRPGRRKNDEEWIEEEREQEMWMEECEYIIYDQWTVTALPRFTDKLHGKSQTQSFPCLSFNMVLRVASARRCHRSNTIVIAR